MIEFRFLTRVEILSLHHFQTGSGTHPSGFPVNAGAPFPVAKHSERIPAYFSGLNAIFIYDVNLWIPTPLIQDILLAEHTAGHDQNLFRPLSKVYLKIN